MVTSHAHTKGLYGCTPTCGCTHLCWFIRHQSAQLVLTRQRRYQHLVGLPAHAVGRHLTVSHAQQLLAKMLAIDAHLKTCDTRGCFAPRSILLNDWQLPIALISTGKHHGSKMTLKPPFDCTVRFRYPHGHAGRRRPSPVHSRLHSYVSCHEASRCAKRRHPLLSHHVPPPKHFMKTCTAALPGTFHVSFQTAAVSQ